MIGWIGITFAAAAVTTAAVWRMRGRLRPAHVAPMRARPPRPVPTPGAQPDAVTGALTQEQVFQRFDELAFGCAMEAREPLHPEIVEAVRKSFAGTADQASAAPRRPLLLPQLMRALNDPQKPRQQIVSIIAQDPALVGGVLKLANSAYYRVSREPVESLDRAVAVMGAEGVRSAAASALFEPLFQARSSLFENVPNLIWERTFFAASAAEAYGATLADADPQAAQLLGFLDGLGRMAVLRASIAQYSAQPALEPDASAIAQLMPSLGVLAAQQHAKAWELSPRIHAALAEPAAGSPTQPRSGLAEALGVGRLIGTLMVLKQRDLVDASCVGATLAAAGVPRVRVDRVVKRLSLA